MNPMTLKEIVTAYLKANGYEGLCNGDIPCGCGIDELFVCEGLVSSGPCSDCAPAMKHIVTADEEDEEYAVGKVIYVAVEKEGNE